MRTINRFTLRALCLGLLAADADLSTQLLLGAKMRTREM